MTPTTMLILLTICVAILVYVIVYCYRFLSTPFIDLNFCIDGLELQKELYDRSLRY